MDKDRFRHDLGDVEGAYQRVLAKVLGQAIRIKNTPQSGVGRFAPNSISLSYK